MIKTARRKTFSSTWHLFVKSPERSPLFLEAADFEKYLQLLEEAKHIFSFELHAYCLLMDQTQVVLKTKHYRPGVILQRIHTKYSVYFQNKYQQKQPLDNAYFGCRAVANNRYFMELTKYIHLSPVFAGIVSTPGEYPWSSYGVYLGRLSKLIHTERILGLFPHNTELAFQEFHERELSVSSPANLQQFYQSYLETLYAFDAFVRKVPVRETKESFHISRDSNDPKLL